MNQETLYAVFGTLGTLLLAVNAFFVKSLWETLTKVDKNVAVSAANIEHMTARINTAETDIKDLQSAKEKMRDGLHSIRNDLGQRIQSLELKQN